MSWLTVHLFDPDGLPWTYRISWYWLYLITLAFTAISGPLMPLALGIYLSLWVWTKGRSLLPLGAYLAATASILLSYWRLNPIVGEISEGALGLLWVFAGFSLRHEVISYYSDREGADFRINPALTLILSVWYINGCLRADYSLDSKGKLPKGILKLNT